jgi:hypothetical protein
MVDRDWAIVLNTASSEATRSFGKQLIEEGLDVELEERSGPIWCFGPDEGWALEAAKRVVTLEELSDHTILQAPPQVRVWDAALRLYLDPDTRNEYPETGDIWLDSEVMPDAIHWRVRVRLQSVFEFRRVERELPLLRRPVIGTGNRHLDLGARDRADAEGVAAVASQLPGVANVDVSEIRGRIRRWLLRQRLAGNYADPSASGHGVWLGDSGGGHGSGHSGH